MNWIAKWIASPDASCRSPLLRKRFELARMPAKAHVLICGLGYHELYINGQRVGDHVLDPRRTDYQTRCLYVEHNVTSLLRAGSNAMGVMLGNGFFTQDQIWGGMSYGRPRAIVQLHGDEDVIVVSDASWRTISGPVCREQRLCARAAVSTGSAAGGASYSADAGANGLASAAGANASGAAPPSTGSGAGRGVMVRTRRGGPMSGAAGFGGGSGARAGAFLAALGGHHRLEEHLRRRRQGDAALARVPLDELASDDFLDRARCALHVDAVVALQQRDHVLARRVEQLRDFVNPDG